MNRKRWWRFAASTTALLLSLATAVAVPVAAHADETGISSVETLAWEGRGAQVPPVFVRIRVSQPVDVPITLTLRTIDGTAVAPDDYAALITQVTIPKLARYVDVQIDIMNDEIAEDIEWFGIELSDPSYGFIANHGPTVIFILPNPPGPPTKPR